jgi:endoribonuclease LACTB2
MLVVRDHGPVRQLEMASLAGRLSGYKVSAFVHRDVLVDTGPPRAAGALARWLDRHPVRAAVVTHWHEDHAGNLALLAGRGVPVHASHRTLELLAGSRPLARYRRAVWGEPRPPGPLTPPAGLPFELVPAPGHSEDHLVVWDAGARIAFLGDLFLGVRACVMHRGEDPYALLNSIERVLALGPAEAFCAHRGRLHDPARVLGARARWLDAALREAERLVDAGWSDGMIRLQVLGREGLTPRLSGGELRKRHFVEAVRARLGAPAA